MKRKILTTIFCFSALLVCFSLSNTCLAQGSIKNGVVIDKKAQDIVTKTANKIKSESPLSFTFSSSNSKKKVKGSQKGSVLLSGDKYTASFGGNSIYCDGKSVWVYNPDTKEVNINDIDKSGNDMMNISSFISSANKNFRAKLIRQDAKGYTIDLTPNRRSSISKVRLVINSSLFRISKMEVHYYSGNIAYFSLSNYRTKVKTSASSFTFPRKKYPKASIVDLR